MSAPFTTPGSFQVPKPMPPVQATTPTETVNKTATVPTEEKKKRTNLFS